MFERTRRGFAMAGSSLKILAAHPKLVLLPLISMSSLILTVVLIGSGMGFGETQHFGAFFYLIGYALLFFLLTFISVFFNAALVACVLEAFAGRPISIAAGISVAVGRLPQILSWAVFSFSVGLVLGFIRDQLRRLGPLAALFGSAAQMSWSILVYFAVPILVVEGLSPTACLNRSKELVKRSWGNAVGVTLGWGFLVLFLVVVPPMLMLGYANSGRAPLPVMGAAAALYVILLFATGSALGAVFRTSLYVYATTGTVPHDQDPALFQTAFR